ncbi:dihydropteroate synthase [Nonomuraea sp. NPDC023979]|uniref:dihydropteroate synthase n=1 Tax=Nonomuraea sp. NPDC023979 TaxID=3154796 RepID=UPI0033E0CD44
MTTSLQPFMPDLIDPVRVFGEKSFDFSRQVIVMAIINRTPNSNLDPHKSMELDSIVTRAEQVMTEGADWIDIGGRAFVGVKEQLPVREEIARVMPAIAAIREKTDAVISVDTHLPDVAIAAHEAGAHIINDTYGLQSPGMVEVIAETGMGVIIAHSLAGPGIHIEKPDYETGVTKEVTEFLRSRVDYALNSGIKPHQIIIDPGHDLHKNTYHSNELSRNFDEIAKIGYPALAAVSNKHFIWESIGCQRGDMEVGPGTLAANILCVYQGARLVRVHDVKSNVQAMRTTEALLGLKR